MQVALGLLGVAVVIAVLWESFETVILPRRVTRPLRITEIFYRLTWPPWRWLGRRVRRSKTRDAYLSYYGPLSTLMLMVVWAAGLIAGFGLIHWAHGLRLHDPQHRPDWFTSLYASGSTFFTLGLGDVWPLDPFARALFVIEAGLGFGFLAAVISYLPVLYQAFSRREARISMLDARAGSPSSVSELLGRYGRPEYCGEFESFLAEWERWTGNLLESHISFPVLSYFRSQHDRQSWLAAITTILDTCAITIAAVPDTCSRQAELTFAMARHAVVDICQVHSVKPLASADRLPQADLARLRTVLRAAGVDTAPGTGPERMLASLRGMYEPYVCGLSAYLAMPLPPWVGERKAAHNWETSPWGRSGSEYLFAEPENRHF